MNAIIETKIVWEIDEYYTPDDLPQRVYVGHDLEGEEFEMLKQDYPALEYSSQLDAWYSFPEVRPMDQEEYASQLAMHEADPKITHPNELLRKEIQAMEDYYEGWRHYYCCYVELKAWIVTPEGGIDTQKFSSSCGGFDLGSGFDPDDDYVKYEESNLLYEAMSDMLDYVEKNYV